MMQIRSTYDSMKNKASKKDFPAPYISEERENEEAQRLAQSVEAQFNDLWAKAG